jgi:hypothetical protein
LIVVISGLDGVVFSAYVVVNTELGAVYLVMVSDLRVVGGRAAETPAFVGHSLKWEWMLSLCCGCGTALQGEKPNKFRFTAQIIKAGKDRLLKNQAFNDCPLVCP